MAGYGNGYLIWYENDGSQGFTSRLVAGSLSSIRSSFALDFDGARRVENTGNLRWRPRRASKLKPQATRTSIFLSRPKLATGSGST